MYYVTWIQYFRMLHNNPFFTNPIDCIVLTETAQMKILYAWYFIIVTHSCCCPNHLLRRTCLETKRYKLPAIRFF